MKLKKIFFSILSLCLTAVMLLALVPQQALSVDNWDYSGKNEVWMFPLGPNGAQWNITSHLGKRNVSGGSVDHQGIDIYCGKGTKVYAAKSGVISVYNSNPNDNRGIFLRIDHRDGTYSQYQHLSKALITSGEVKQGTPIGQSGNTGGIQEFHLHFEICMSNGTPLNSMPLNESAFQGMNYWAPNACPNPIPAAWLRAWQSFSNYTEMGIHDTNSYTAKAYYPYVNQNERPPHSAGVVEANWPPVYLQSRIMYYFDRHAKIELRDRDTYPAFEATAANASGSYKVSVQFMQVCLSDLGYSLDVDGFHGPGSTATVQSFQGKYGISQTGNIDEATWNKVIELMHAKYPPLKKLDITDPTTYPTFTTTVPAYVSGTVGYIENVKFVQLCLKDLGYSIDVDGHHGPGSTAVVRTFQQANGLTASGSIDKATWDKLVELMVLKYHECADEDKEHHCDVCGEALGECSDINGDGVCDYCGEDIPNPFLAELCDGVLQLTNAPENLTVIAAAYDTNGKLLKAQVETAPGEAVAISVQGEKLLIFFISGSGVPIRQPLAAP